MTHVLRLRVILFGLFATILAAAWIRGAGNAMGGNAADTDLAIAATLIPFAIGTGFGSLWMKRPDRPWWHYYTLFGGLGYLLALWIPNWNTTFQSISEKHGAFLNFWLLLVFSIVPWISGGVAFARLTVGTAGDIVIYLCLGAGSGIFFLDVLAGPILGGSVLLIVSAIGIISLAFGEKEPPVLSSQKIGESRKALIFSWIAAFALAACLRLLLIYIVQFIPGSRDELSWVYISLLLVTLTGVVGAGSFHKASNSPILWATLLILLVSSAMLISSFVVVHLSDPAMYLNYLLFFGIREGSAFQVILLTLAIAGLPSFLAGAALRRVFDPVSSRGRPTVAASTCASGIGASVGFLFGDWFTLPHGIEFHLMITACILIALGFASSLTLARGEIRPKVLCLIVAIVSACGVIPFLPGKIDPRNPHQLASIAFKQSLFGPDGFSRESNEPGQSSQIWQNYNALSSSTEALEQLEIAISATLAQGPEEVLLLSPLTTQRMDLFKSCGVGTIDLATQPAQLGELVRQMSSNRTQPVVTPHANALGVSRQYPLILALPEPLWPVAAGSRWNAELFDGLKERLSENGCFILWLRVRDCSASALRSMSRNFAEVFPVAQAYFAFQGFEGPSLALVGRLKESSDWIQSTKTRDLFASFQKNFSKFSVRSPDELSLFQIASRERILDATVGAIHSSGPLPHLAWKLSPRFQSAEQTQGMEFLLALATSPRTPSTDSDESWIRDLLSGFHSHLKSLPRRSWENYLEKGQRFDDSELHRFYAAIKGRPNLTPLIHLWETLGETLLENKQYEYCATHMTQLSALLPDHAPFHEILAEALYEQGNFEPSSKAARRALALDSKSLRGWRYQGLSQAKLGNAREALRALEEARKLEPRDIQTLDGLARAYREMGDLNRAKELVEEAKKIAPTDELVKALVESFAQ